MSWRGGGNALALIVIVSACGAHADEAASVAPSRPRLMSNRWQENWSALVDPGLRTEPGDELKFILLSPSDPNFYLSFGATLRERFELANAPSFGVGKTNRNDSYLLQRIQLHADLHLNEDWRIFAQIEDARAFDKKNLGKADQNPPDLRLAFLEYGHAFPDGALKARIGRQEFAFDLQRFVSNRDGPNVRQAFDAAWLDFEVEPWRVLGFVSRPVQYYREQAFDDRSTRDVQFHTLRLERHVFGQNELSAYYSFYGNRNASYLDASGSERRHIFDIRFAGEKDGFDWDVEGMAQSGSVGAKSIRAWAVGARAGYRFSMLPLRPRIGIQADAASGDRRRGDGRIETFDPLFPNGYYFTLAGFTGYANLIHLKPSLTLAASDKVTVLAGVGLQWRETTADAIYVFPNIAVAGTAGSPGRWTGAYEQLRVDWAVTANLSAALECVHFAAGDTIRRAGGHDGNYLGAEVKFLW
ncbi:alginate export family protein [Methylosinus sporium]|uniref:Alginate export family protein n=2 Tax=Methylosinus sporium TaxID=428 RepID=A0A549T8T2_METSR|nr:MULTISPECIES: alginate export family protein [Methylosinus]MBU3890191.1 alginate export family protein [Methylosinus sp. KRF6]TRL38278.1 alginate export family protein [Methylosinus sporium]